MWKKTKKNFNFLLLEQVNMMVQIRDQSAEAELDSEATFRFLKMNRASSEVLIQVDEQSTVQKLTFHLCGTNDK